MLLRRLTTIVFETLELLLGWSVASLLNDDRSFFKLLNVPPKDGRDDPMEGSAEVDDV